MVLLKTILSAVAVLLVTSQVQAAPAKLDKRLLLPTAPSATDIDGAHLLLQNDVDSSKIIKNAYVLLSRPRGYYDGMNACLSMGDGMVLLLFTLPLHAFCLLSNAMVMIFY